MLAVERILNSYKPILPYMVNGYFLLKGVGEYYCKPYKTIETVIKRNRNEFEQHNEIKVLKSDELKEFKKTNDSYKGINALTLININGLLRVGLLLQDSIISEELKLLLVRNGIPDIYENIFTSINHRALLKQNQLHKIIQETLDSLVSVDTQVKCGNYRVDFLIDNNIVVECDEYGHENYRLNEELARENFLRNKGYRVVRYNPDGDESVYSFINRLYKVILRSKQKAI